MGVKRRTEYTAIRTVFSLQFPSKNCSICTPEQKVFTLQHYCWYSGSLFSSNKLSILCKLNLENKKLHFHLAVHIIQNFQEFGIHIVRMSFQWMLYVQVSGINTFWEWNVLKWVPFRSGKCSIFLLLLKIFWKCKIH